MTVGGGYRLGLVGLLNKLKKKNTSTRGQPTRDVMVVLLGVPKTPPASPVARCTSMDVSDKSPRSGISMRVVVAVCEWVSSSSSPNPPNSSSSTIGTSSGGASTSSCEGRVCVVHCVYCCPSPLIHQNLPTSKPPKKSSPPTPAVRAPKNAYCEASKS